MDKMVFEVKNKKIKNFFKVLMLILLLLIIVVYAVINNELQVEEIDLKENVRKYTFKPTSDSPEDFSLPVVVIDTDGQKLDENIKKEEVQKDDLTLNMYKKSTRYLANLKLYEPKNPDEPTLDETIRISLRGQSSLSTPKKQFAVSFENEEGQENPVEILDMPANSKWVINGTYFDKSLIRNYLAYNMASQTMKYAPRVRFVEVFLNDTQEELSYKKHYIGVYLIIEKIERGKDRVDIQKCDERYKDVSFIIARDKTKIEDVTYETNWGNLEEDFIVGTDGIIRMRSLIKNVYPGTESLTTEYKNKIEEYINEFENVLYSSDFKKPDKGYRNYIDVNSFIDMAIINELFKNIDGCEVSTYFYKDIGGKLTAGPVWDFDRTLGNTSNEEVNEPTGFRMVDTIWFNRLFQDEYFCDLYEKRYKHFRETIWNDIKLEEMIDDAVNQLDGAKERNTQRWYAVNLENGFSYDEEINKLKNFLLNRVKWMDENIKCIKRYEEVIE